MNWMIFRPEGKDILYLWAGEWASPFYVAPHEGVTENWYWNGNQPTDPLSQSEINFLDEIAKTKRKQIFVLPRTKARYQVVSRGVYENQNQS